ncbi:MAG: SGNH/GDSL hydrolase family protein [Candidatus Hydrogenedentes bacterium]|nr:SGNH/GDSL hydrolase family protein [Candidatus Hydrogenedentota bacterium]
MKEKPGRIRRRLGYFFLLVVLACPALYFYFTLYHPVGKGPAGPAVPREAFAQAWTNQRVLLLGLGDSVTAGFGSTKGHSYFERLIESPPDEFQDMQGKTLKRIFPHLDFLDLAVSGSDSSQHLDRIESDLPVQAADVFGIVVMTTSGNDLIHWYGRSKPAENAMYGATWEEAQPWIQNFETRFNKMISEIVSRFPGGCLILLGDIYDPSDGRGDPESAWLPAWPDALKIHGAYNAVIRRVGERYPEVHVVPIHEAFLGHGVHCRKFWLETYRKKDPHYWYADNLEDPNDRGYDAIRRLMLRALLEARDQVPKS